MNSVLISDIYDLFKVEVSDYWETHYNFDKISVLKKKKMSYSFIDLILINTIIPVRFAYEQSLQKELLLDSQEKIINLIEAVQPEKNIVVDKFVAIGISATNGFETQSLLQLKKEYCDAKKCLQCAVGVYLLKN